MNIYYRWSDNDHRRGRFIYARERRNYRSFGIALTSNGDEDEASFSTLRLHLFGHTFIAILPAIIKPVRTWVDTSQHEWASSSPKKGYWDQHRNEYSFSIAEGYLHVHYGAQTHDSQTDKSWCWQMPWLDWRHVRRSFYGVKGEHIADMPHWDRPALIEWKVRHAEEEAVEQIVPTVSFGFLDMDGKRLDAKTRIEEREWRRGRGWWRWLSLVSRNMVRRSLTIEFSGETGRRKGSWKGGTIGTSIDMLPGELHEAAFRRHCALHGMTFVEVLS